MTLYIVLSMYMLILLLFSQCDNLSIDKKYLNYFQPKIIFFVSMFMFWFLTAFRSPEIGNDTINYINIFTKYSNIENININGRIEIGWQLLCFAVGLFTNNPQNFIIFISSLLYILSGFYIYRYSKNVLLSVVILFFLMFPSFASMLRQSLAICLVAFAYKNIENKSNIYKTLALLVLATSIHYTAGISFLIFFRKYFVQDVKKLLLFLVILSCLSISGVIDKLVLAVIPATYAVYFFTRYAHTGYLAVTMTILLIMLPLLLVYMVNYEKEKQGDNLILPNIFLALTVCAFGYMVNLFTRLADYFTFFLFLEIPNIIDKFCSKKKVALSFIIGIIFMVSFLTVLYFRPNWNHLYPYHFFWEI